MADKFIGKYGIETDSYDVIKGWRANASYFYIAKEFVSDNIDIDARNKMRDLINSDVNMVTNVFSTLF